jgi:hypothetical protein
VGSCSAEEISGFPKEILSIAASLVLDGKQEKSEIQGQNSTASYSLLHQISLNRHKKPRGELETIGFVETSSPRGATPNLGLEVSQSFLTTQG